MPHSLDTSRPQHHVRFDYFTDMNMNLVNLRWNRAARRLLGVGVFVALAGGAVLTAAAHDGGHRYGGGAASGSTVPGLRSERALEAAGVSAEQRAQVRQIMDAARTDLEAGREAARGLRTQLRQLFTEPTVDARAAETLRQQLLAQHDQASARLMQAMLEVSRVLSPEQRAALAEMAKDLPAHYREVIEEYFRQLAKQTFKQ